MKQHYIYILKPHRENFASEMTGEEAAIMSEHFIYLKDLLEKGTLILAGPETTGKFGLALIETESEQEARNIMNNDPAFKKNVCGVTLYPYRISLIRK